MTMAGRVTPSGGIPLAGDVGPAEAGVQMTGGLASGGIAEMGGVPGGQVEQGGMPNNMGGMWPVNRRPRVLGPVISEVQLSIPTHSTMPMAIRPDGLSFLIPMMPPSV